MLKNKIIAIIFCLTLPAAILFAWQANRLVRRLYAQAPIGCGVSYCVPTPDWIIQKVSTINNIRLLTVLLSMPISIYGLLSLRQINRNKKNQKIN